MITTNKREILGKVASGEVLPEDVITYSGTDMETLKQAFEDKERIYLVHNLHDLTTDQRNWWLKELRKLENIE